MRGKREFQKIITQLPAVMSKQFFRELQTEILRPVAAEMRSKLTSQTQVRTGNLLRSMGIKHLATGDAAASATLAGHRYGHGGNHAHLIEFGTKERSMKRKRIVAFKGSDGQIIFRNVQRTGKGPALPFIGPVIDKALPQIEREYPDKAQKYMEDFIKRNVNKR